MGKRSIAELKFCLSDSKIFLNFWEIYEIVEAPVVYMVLWHVINIE
jgi:hypothetical protein